ncbi:Double zinc ribbon [Candidatus Gugararchaeum adminiculabundum]|nr:Double zinc ribbon [Candidatus Gugararchaeum adminiculabundum]
MGIIDALKKAGKSMVTGSRGSGMTLTCPNCKEKVNSEMERCPKCGVHLSSMFKVTCPNCKKEIGLKDESCKYCGTNFKQKSSAGGGRQKYRCPICGYLADYYMLQCPACGTKFSS